MGLSRIEHIGLALLCLWSLCRDSHQSSQCEPIRIPMCMSMPWNLTHMPNFMEQSSQQNAQLKIEEYQPLVLDNCSQHLQFFLCALFAPICMNNFHDNPIPPCQEVCEEVKSDCEPVISEKYNKTWPADIDCSTFPRYSNEVCIDPQAIQLEPPSIAENEDSSVKKGRNSCNCRKKTKLHMRRYVQANFDYVLKVAGEGTRQVGQDLIMSWTIRTIIKNEANLKVRKHANLILWTEGKSCADPCPSIRYGKEYIIACNKRIRNGRLLFDINKCMIARWKDKWTQTIESWERIASLPEKARNDELRRLRRLKKSTNREEARDEPADGS
ncbi:secreted frizzled-related protein 4-like [Watersipora subatra]|uniref:secreted frizzled-related protein 4-like n=1 Tax=Watersipora subatra TaxID=2589382 RepID=UPI00355C19CF